MWRIWANWPSPDARGYLLFSIGVFWTASFIIVYFAGAIILLAIYLTSDEWPVWLLALTFAFIESLPFFLPGLLLFLIGWNRVRGRRES